MSKLHWEKSLITEELTSRLYFVGKYPSIVSGFFLVCLRCHLIHKCVQIEDDTHLFYLFFIRRTSDISLRVAFFIIGHNVRWQLGFIEQTFLLIGRCPRSDPSRLNIFSITHLSLHCLKFVTYTDPHSDMLIFFSDTVIHWGCHI